MAEPLEGHGEQGGKRESLPSATRHSGDLGFGQADAPEGGARGLSMVRAVVSVGALATCNA